jgi:hypothetical protein
MPTVTYADLASLMNLTVPDDISTVQLEQIIDTSIDALNVWNANLGNLTGTVGAKTGSYTSKQWGAIKLVARQVYYGFYKNLDVAQLQGMSVTVKDLLSDPANVKLIQQCAEQLRSDLPVDMPFYDVRIG